MPIKYLGNPKYVEQLESYYASKNATVDAQLKYIQLTCQDKVILAQQNIVLPSTCCKETIVWETWLNDEWNLDTHAWATVWTI